MIAATALYVAHAGILGDWIVDDAGISFSYARSLALASGLVAQAGVEPVEGFTNLLWVLVLAPFLRAGLFDPVVTPKALSVACVVATLALTGGVLRGAGGRSAWLVAGALSATVLGSGFAVWTASGLENALYALTVAALASLCAAERPGGASRSVAAALVMFLVFCTRPDGALYFWIYPFVAGAALGKGAHRALRSYTVTFVGAWAALTVFRLLTFRDVLPNPFYAKRGEGAALFEWLLGALPLPAAGAAVILLGGCTIALVGCGALHAGRALSGRVPHARIRRHISWLFFGTAVLVYQALRGDWMPEYRFATPAFVFGPAAVLATLWDAAGAGRSPARRTAVGWGLALLVVAGGAGQVLRTRQLAPSPALSFQDVRALARRIAESLPQSGPGVTVLTPDIGGALWEDRFQVVDLMGLIDRKIARPPLRARERLGAYLLHERRVDAVWHHGPWLHRAGLAGNPEFAALYRPVWEDRGGDGTLLGGLSVRRTGPEGSSPVSGAALP